MDQDFGRNRKTDEMGVIVFCFNLHFVPLQA